jgi:HSP20 family molecular chaperone IbpA
MLKKKCSGCANKIDRKFNFCPWCGYSIKGGKEESDFGLLGRDDIIGNINLNNPSQADLPFGLGKMVNSLVKQLEKELANIENDNQNLPKGFSVRIQSGMPMQRIMEQPKQKVKINKIVSEEEQIRRQRLPKKEAESRVKRLSDKIIYEVNAPGIKNKDDIVITKLEDGFEIKIYTDNACYTKKVPLNVEVENYFLKKDTVVIELKE